MALIKENFIVNISIPVSRETFSQGHKKTAQLGGKVLSKQLFFF